MTDILLRIAGRIREQGEIWFDGGFHEQQEIGKALMGLAQIIEEEADLPKAEKKQAEAVCSQLRERFKDTRIGFRDAKVYGEGENMHVVIWALVPNVLEVPTEIDGVRVIVRGTRV